MKKTQLIKGLKSQLKIAEGDYEALKLEAENKQRLCSAQRKHIYSHKDKIEALEKDGVLKVSEHAILRYIERVKGINISDIENEILTNEVKTITDDFGGTANLKYGKVTIVIKDFTVITIK